MPRPTRSARPRRLTAAVLAVAPVLLATAGPASAAVAVQVAPAPDGCGVTVTVSGLGEGPHTAVVRATLPGTGDPVPVVPAVPEGDVPATPVPTAPPAPEPLLSEERTLTGDGEVVVVLDAAAVPDADPRVVVAVTVDGEAPPPVELALPGCGAPVTPTPTTPGTPSPTSDPTSGPTTGPTTDPTTDPTSSPGTDPTSGPEPTAEPAAPSAPASPSPSPTGSPAGSPTPTTSPRPTTAPTATPTPTGAAPTSPSPVLNGAAAPTPVPTLADSLEQAYGAFDGGSGTSGYLSLMSFAAAPQLDAAVAPAPVPAPVIAAPEGSAAGVLPAASSGSPLDDLLPSRPADAGDEPVTAQLAAPDLATAAVPDPLVDLAPAAFVLSASLGGLLMAGRRRTG